MKYISQEALTQIIDAFIDASHYRQEHSKKRDDILRFEGEIRAFVAVRMSLDSVVGIDSDEEAV